MMKIYICGGEEMLYDGLVIDNTYQIVNEIGKGGMGVVYLAYHIRLQKYIVMKKLKGHINNAALIRNEVDILKGLHHPYLPQVYDFFEFEGSVYTVIDYINGHDFDYYISNGYVFEESQLIKWLKQLCEVLEYLHTQPIPIYHTDIKPGNIIITAEGNVCLIDFGISLFSNDSVKGFSEDYCSPEQFYNVQWTLYGDKSKCVALDERTDVYSLGAAFYHIMTGVKPNVRNEAQPALSRYNLSYSEAFVSIIEKMMIRDRDRRFRSASKVLKALDDIRKQDSRYKKYILLQIASSVTAVIFVFIGIVLVYSGYRDNLINNYSEDYSKFVSANNSGNTEETVDLGTSILNNRSYSSVIDAKTKAQILHSIGDCFFNDEDYSNASKYYASAVENVDLGSESELYYRDYTFSLILNGEFDEANKFIEAFREKNPNSSVLFLVEAELNYKNRNYSEALSKVEMCLSSQPDQENRYTAYILKGDICLSSGDPEHAAAAFDEALSIKENVSVLRRLGSASLMAANKRSFSDAQSLSKACTAYETINKKYYPTQDDVINLAQTYRLLGRSSECIKVLNEYLSLHGEVFRVLVQLSIAGDYFSDPAVSGYCERAHSAYLKLSSAEKNSVGGELEIMQQLYSKHCSAAW